MENRHSKSSTDEIRKLFARAHPSGIHGRCRLPRFRIVYDTLQDFKANDEKKARESFKALEPEIMRGVTKNVLKLNTASRKLTRLASAIRKIAK